ncbi:hypothetical protein BJX63DRAFT_395978 [Aspergillus granulosus]|uniref:Uncharacterized protein n=1 Tax=Aspergillus granulosus TaxID=176169 RepID=A0ABR4HB94_9EURO
MTVPPWTPLPRVTATLEAVAEIKGHRHEGHQYVEFADLVPTIRANRSPIKKPGHCLKLGAALILRVLCSSSQWVITTQDSPSTTISAPLPDRLEHKGKPVSF